ncbi:MAG: hypothetical protein FJY97_19945, partial [candidate division Zixibacteria bacterium]|nr:hypothetical protein [candidate division Zixibacteria bacterium]
MTLNPFKPFAAYLSPYLKRILAGVLFLLASQALSTAIPIAMQWAVDAAKAGYEAFRADDLSVVDHAAHDVLVYALAAGLLALAVMGFQMAMRWMFSSMARFVEYDMRTRYFEHLLTLSLSFYNSTSVGDLMTRATNDIGTIRMFLAFGLRMILTASMALPLSLVVMMTIDWQLALLALLPMPVMALVMNRVAGRVKVGFRASQEQFSTITARIQENLSGIRVVKAYVRRYTEMMGFRTLNDEYLRRNNM